MLLKSNILILFQLSKTFLSFFITFSNALPSAQVVYDYYEEEDCIEKSDLKGINYEGKISETTSGITCQKWNVNYPHDLSQDAIEVKKYLNIDYSTMDHNYCRNPGGLAADGPICYTTDPKKRWDTCKIPVCSEQQQLSIPPILKSQASPPTPKNPYPVTIQEITEPPKTETPAVIVEAQPENDLEFFDLIEVDEEDDDNFLVDDIIESPLPPNCYTGNGQFYEMDTSVTVSGHTCQNWNANSPVPLTKFHKYIMNKYNVNIRDYPENHCRNPGGHFDKPMCITDKASKKIEECQVDLCSNVITNDAGDDEFFEVDDYDSKPTGIERQVQKEDKLVTQEMCGKINPATDCYEGLVKNACFQPSIYSHKYLMCQRPNKWVESLSCPEGLIWDHSSLACNWPDSY